MKYSGDVVQGMIRNRTPKYGLSFLSASGYLDNGDILYYPTLGDTVYRVAVSERTVSPAYIIESGDEDVKLMNDEQRREMDPNAELPEYEKRNYFFPVEFFNVGSHILLRSGMDDMYGSHTQPHPYDQQKVSCQHPRNPLP